MANSILEYLKKMGEEKGQIDSALSKPGTPAPAGMRQRGMTVETGKEPDWMASLRMKKSDPMSLPAQPSQEELDMGAYDPSAQFMREAMAKEEERKKMLAQRAMAGKVAGR